MGKVYKLLFVILSLVIFSSFNVYAENDDAKGADVLINIGEGKKTPNCVYGEKVTIDISLVNVGKNDASDVVITPVLDSSTDVFPFEITEMNYNKELDKDGEKLELPGTDSGSDKSQRTKIVTYDFTTRKDVQTGYMKLSFIINYKVNGVSQSTTKDVFVKTEGAPKPTASTPKPTEPTKAPVATEPVVVNVVVPEAKPEPMVQEPINSEPINSEPISSGPINSDPISDSEQAVSVPRVIVSGFTTEPVDVKAGDQFKLTLHITNTSSKTIVNNLEFTLQSTPEGEDLTTVAAAFLPVAGANTIFVNSIGKEETKDITIDMTAKADLAQKPYVIDVAMKYEDSKANQYTSEASVSIPVKQEARLDVSELQVMPASIMIGQESNIMFSIYNTGKTKLYNVSVKFQADSISGGDTFVGNIEPGATGNVDVMLAGGELTTDDGLVKVLISYEDEAGNQSNVEKELTLFVNEAYMDVDNSMNPDEEFPVEENTSSFKGIVIVVIVLLIVAGVVYIILRRKKMREEGIDEDEIS